MIVEVLEKSTNRWVEIFYNIRSIVVSCDQYILTHDSEGVSRVDAVKNYIKVTY
jgi:hypothetical protein